MSPSYIPFHLSLKHFSRLIRDLRPKYIVAAFDVGRHTFRHELYKGYKAHRDELPEDLIHQFEYAIPVLQSLGCVCVQKKGYEADDVLVITFQLICPFIYPSTDVIVIYMPTFYRQR